MTKTNVLAPRTRRDHIAYLHLFVGDDDPVDQKLHKFASVLEGSLGQAATHSLTEILYGSSYSSKLHALVCLRFELQYLCFLYLLLLVGVCVRAMEHSLHLP